MTTLPFVDRLSQTLVDNAIYVGLFGFTLHVANKHLGLRPSATEDERRDAMGTLALQCLSSIEGELTVYLTTDAAYLHAKSPLATIIHHARDIARRTGNRYTRRGIDGKALLTLDAIAAAARGEATS